jgi:cysteine desulfurase
MGFDEMTAASAIRVSLGPKTSEQDVMGFADKWLAQMNKHRASARQKD